MKDYEVNMYCYLRMITTLELLSFAMVYVEFSGFLSVDSMLKSFFSTKIMELRNGVGLRWVGGGGDFGIRITTVNSSWHDWFASKKL